MKITEIRELYKGFDEGKFIDVDVKVKDYISLAKKLMVIEGYDYQNDEGETLHSNGIVDNVVVEKNGLYVTDKFLYEMHVMFSILENYTDIDFEGLQFTTDDYDMFMRSRLFDKVVDSSIDYVQFMCMLEDSLKTKLEYNNSFSRAMRDTADKLLLAIGDLTDSKKLDNILKTVNKAIKNNPELRDYLKVYVDKNGANK